MPRELRESLIEALYDRVDLWQQDPTSEAVFGPAADDEVARLVETPGFAGDLVGRHAAGMLFWCRFLALGEADQGTYSIAVDLLQQVAVARPDIVPEQLLETIQLRTRSVAVADQAIESYNRYEHSKNPADLDGAIELMASAAGDLSQDRTGATRILFNLGSFCWLRYRHRGDLADLFTAVDQFTAAAEADHLGELSDAAPHLQGHASDLWTAYEQTFVPELLSCAIQLQRCSTLLTTTHRASYGAFLAYLIQVAYEHTAQPALLDDALAVAEWSVALEPGNASALISFAIALNHRAMNAGDPGIADEAVELARRAAAAAPAADQGRALQVLGMALRICHSLTGDPGALDGAVDAMRQALAATDSGHPDHVRRLMALAEVLRIAAADPVHASEAVAIARRVLAATSPADPEYPIRRSLLVVALLKLYEVSGDAGTLAEAIAEGRSVQRAVDPAAAGYPAVVRSLATALSKGSATDDDIANQDEAVELLRDCLSTVPQSHPETPKMREDLARLQAIVGHARLRRFIRAPDDADLDRIIEASRAGSTADKTALTTLCTALRLRFEAYSDRADLDRSVAVGLEAVDALAGDPDGLVRAQTAVGFALRLRYEQTEHLSSLDDAIDLLQAAVDATDVDVDSNDPDQLPAGQLNMLGNARWARYLRTGDSDELELAVAELRRSLLVGAAHGSIDPGHLSNLALALRSQYDRSNEPAVLDEMVEILERAVRESRPDNNRLPYFQSNLGGALLSKFKRDGALADLDAAIAAHQDAIAAPAAGPMFRASAGANLGACWVWRFQRTDNPADLRAAISEYRAAAQAPLAGPMLRCQVAQELGVLAAREQDWQEALGGYSVALAQLPFVAPRFLDRSDQEHVLRQLDAIGPDAAACALQAAGDADGTAEANELWASAVELLDQGRGVLLTHQLEARGDLSRLHAHAPALAARFEELRDRRNQQHGA
ncbi:MAG TPA: hypothetical protein VGD71_27575 [Kribbella sp.]